MRIIAGEWRGRRLKPLRGKAIRPTTDRIREAWMSIVGPLLPGADVLDLFAGSGAVGLEALSRGADSVVFVERSRDALRVLRENIALVGAGDRARVVARDVLSYLRSLEGPPRFDLAFADPPYESGLAEATAQAFLRAPFASELWIEHRTKAPLGEVPGAEARRYGDTTLTRIPYTEELLR